PNRGPNGTLVDGDTVTVAGESLRVLHTPGHSPGGICLLTDPDGANPGHVFGGDTLFNGGPGATGRSFSSFETIIESIRMKLLPLPPETVVHTGHGDDTTIGAEAPGIEAAAAG
ncbi:MAG TPA: MBL fold metallo-hydrolase, partial [Acidimicrobiales bacterium]